MTIRSMLRRLCMVVMTLAAGHALAQPANAPAACPTPPQVPTQEALNAALRVATDHGVLWTLERDGRKSYLFGTIHVGKLEWVVPGPRLREALLTTDVMALEIDPTDTQMLRRMIQPAPGAPAANLPAALKTRIAKRIDVACLPPEARPIVDAQHPVMQAMTLTVLEARWEGLDAAYAQEFMLAGFARKGQRRIVSLETPELQMAALMPKDANEMIKLLEGMLDQIDKGAGRRSIAHLGAAWARGDLDELSAYERWCECALDDSDRKQLARLIDERNPGIAERLDALIGEGGRVFAGVGALHMTGPKALPQLMRERGYKVERVIFQ